MRVPDTLTPLMYREANVFSLARSRPAFQVRTAAPEETEEELRGVAPYLLVRNDTDGLEPGVLEGVPCWVEVFYSDSMDAKICLAGRVEEARDMSTQGLLRVADEAADLLHYTVRVS